MASWRDVETSAPEFAEKVQELFDAYRHKTLATLRKDGSPRISGIEAEFVGGDLQLGAMWHSVKALDLRRDPRFALHSGTGDADPATWKGDAKIAGRAEEIIDSTPAARMETGDGEAPPGPSHLFRADITEVVLTWVGDPPDHLVIEVWREGQGLQRLERR